MTSYINGGQECLDIDCQNIRWAANHIAQARLEFLKRVPDLYRSARIENVVAKMPDRPKDLLILGKGGRGKTYAAVAWTLKQVEAAGWLAFWYEVPILLARFRASFRDKAPDSELNIIREVEKPNIIILDDLGAEKSTDYSSQSLYCILSRRINEGKTTVVTTNLTMAELHAAEPRIASRLAGFEIVGITGDDRRMRR